MNLHRSALRRLGRLALALSGLLLLYWVALFAFQRELIFPRDAANSRLQGNRGKSALAPSFERGWLNTTEGRTEYWLQLAPEATPESPAGLVVFAHGNAELIDGQDWVFEGFRELGLHVAMCEYRGYGRTSGSPSQSDITADQLAMVQLLLHRPEIDPTRIVYFGRSIGTGVACALASEHAPWALILLSPFRSLKSMASGFFAPGFLVRDPFDNESVLRDFKGPVLLMHGRQDTIIPFEHSLALQKAAPHAQLSSFDHGHNNMPVGAPEFWRAIEEFLGNAFRRPTDR